MSDECDGSGYIEFADHNGYLNQRSCRGCGQCQATVPPAGPDEVIEVGIREFSDLLRASMTLRGGTADPPMDAEAARVMVTHYLPALLEMARLWILAQDESPQITISAHRVFDSGHDVVGI